MRVERGTSEMLAVIRGVNLALCIFSLFVTRIKSLYAILGIFLQPKKYQAKKDHRFAVVIPARNERSVIPALIASIKKQNYPQKLIDIFVIADNCTDDTAQVARQSRAKVYEQFNRQLVGKGLCSGLPFSPNER